MDEDDIMDDDDDINLKSYYVYLRTICYIGKDQNNSIQTNSASLLEYNQNPHISSRLALSPSSLFFTGVIGNKNRNGIPKKHEDKPNKVRI